MWFSLSRLKSGIGQRTMYFEIRDYRSRISGKRLVPFRVVFRESDLQILAEKELSREALEILREERGPLEAYIKQHPQFLTSLKPLPFVPEAPALVQKMLLAGKKARVGPMAAVAGALAEAVGRALLETGLTQEVVVENGGDIFLSLKREAVVAIWAGKSPLSGRLGLKIPSSLMPCGVCTSSGTVGHSLSLGCADALCVISKDTALADALATSLGNLVRGPKDLKRLPKAAQRHPEILGLVCIVGEELLAFGPAVEFVPLANH